MTAQDESRFPTLGENAMYVFHRNECYDWGTYGWLLNQQFVDTTSYSHYIFINCSVRGPYVPQYLQVCLSAAVLKMKSTIFWTL